MASRQSVSSILKPQKVRAPLKEIESVDQDADEDTATMPKKKVSFSSMNNIKMFIAGASSLTVPTLFDDQVSMMSDSSNGDKTKLSGKLEKSDGQITIESTNCTNMEESGRVVIEYESPSDNMEMTEALSGKIFSDTIYTVDTNISKRNECSLDYSANNMEFTQAVALGQILTADLSNSMYVEMSETFINKDEQSNTELQPNSSIPLHEKYAENTSYTNLNPSNMEITRANIKSHITNISSMNESSNMELTYVSSVPIKSSCLINHQTTCSMVELTSDEQLLEDNCELINETFQKSVSSESEATGGVNENSNCELEILREITPEINKCSNHENVICEFENSYINEEIVDKLSSSVLSMDIDSASKCEEYDISYVNMDCLKLASQDQTNPTVPIILETKNKELAVRDIHDDYSNGIEILKHTNCDVTTAMVSTSFVEETSPKQNLNKSNVVVQEPQLKSVSLTHASVFNESCSPVMDTSLEAVENRQRNYSRKTLIHSAPLIIQKRSFINEDTVNTSAVVEEDQQKRYSRKSIRLISVIDQNLLKENQDNSDLPDLIQENQNKCSVKSSSPTSDFNQTQSQEIQDSAVSSATMEENQPRYPRKSIACLPTLNQVESSEEMNLSNTFMYDKTQISEKENTSVMVENDLQKNYSRRTMGPTSNYISDGTDSSLSNYSFISHSKNEIFSSTDDLSLVSNNSKINHVDIILDSFKHEKKFISKFKDQSILLNVIDDDDLNSPFRKKSKKNVSYLQSADQSIYDLYENHTERSNNKENKSDNTGDVGNTEHIEYSKMDISVESEQEDYCKEKISSQENDPTLYTTFSLNNMSHIKQPSNILICDNANSSSLINDLLEHNSKDKSTSYTRESNISVVLDTQHGDNEFKKSVHDDMCEQFIQADQNEIPLNESAEGNVSLTESNGKNIGESFKLSMDTNDMCVHDVSKMSISDNAHQKYRKSSIGCRKRSYSNLDNASLSCSSFMHNPNDCTSEKLDEHFLKESPVKTANETSMKTEEYLVENTIEKEVEIVNEDSVKEHLNIEVLEFLRKWNDLYFIESKLVLDTCNNSEWVFNMLNNNIKLTIKYSPILNDNSYLKVEDILLNSQLTIEDEIIKFGTNWILSKYSPKIYKQICFTSRDVELLLKSLQEDIKFVSLVMQNMVFVRDVYCVTFKDNKAQFFLQSIHPLLMACIDVTLTNIHKLSVKDITVDCLFGVFDIKILDEIMEKLTKDCNVLQYLVEYLKNSIRTTQVAEK